MAKNEVGRMLIVKSVCYRAYRNKTLKNWTPPRIEDEIKLIESNTHKVKERHYPILEDGKKIPDGVRCHFINEFKPLDNGGVIFTVCSYVKGHVPETFSPNMDEDKVDISALALEDENGDQKELVYTYRVLAFGQIIIVENLMGSGGIGGLEKALRSLINKFRPKGHGVLELSDIMANNLRDLIKAKGGINKLIAKISHEVYDEGSTYARKLSSTLRTVSGTNKCVISWESDDNHTIDADDAINLFDEVDSDHLDSVSITFKAGGGLSDLSEYRERKPVKIQVTPEGLIAVSEVEVALKDYLNQLRSSGSKGPIKADGTLRNIKRIGA